MAKCDKEFVLFFVVRCNGGDCPPGANDKCTLQFRQKGTQNWITEPGRWRLRRFGEEYRCECLRPAG